MLRFSIRELLLLTLAVACLVGWRTDHARSTTECSSLNGQLNRLQVELQKSAAVAKWLQAQRDTLAAEKSRLEAENSRVERRMLEHNTRAMLELEKFKRVRIKS